MTRFLLATFLLITFAGWKYFPEREFYIPRGIEYWPPQDVRKWCYRHWQQCHGLADDGFYCMYPGVRAGEFCIWRTY